MLHLYNTMTRCKESFNRKSGDTVKMYTCGPTVYKPTHIGHIIGPVIYDTLRRYMTHLGLKVKWVLNVTDIDDKIIDTAKDKGMTTKELVGKHLEDYINSLHQLNVTGIDSMPMATEYVPQMVKMIEELVGLGFAYNVGGNVYFDTTKSGDYGILCNRDKKMMREGESEYAKNKKNPTDFALWKNSKIDDPLEFRYESSFGCGRPGWHIECSCMARETLGNSIDIHGGGLDLQFPHHENEIAQTEAITNTLFSEVWMHHGLVKVGTAKMSGSLGNYIRVLDILKIFPADVLRMFVLSTHYRSPFDIGIIKEGIPSAITSTSTAYKTVLRMSERINSIIRKSFWDVPFTIPKGAFADMHLRFCEFLDDDFNTAGAMGVLFELCNYLNRTADKNKLSTNTPESDQEFLQGVTVFKFIIEIFGFTFKPFSPQTDLTTDLIKLLVAIRAKIKTEGLNCNPTNPSKAIFYGMADVIRTRLREIGVVLEDTGEITKWRML